MAVLDLNVVINKDKMVALDNEEFSEFKKWKNNRDEKKRKSGNYWLTQEGRKEVRELWDEDDGEIPIVYLNEIERLEALLEEVNFAVREAKEELEDAKVFPVS